MTTLAVTAPLSSASTNIAASPSLPLTYERIAATIAALTVRGAEVQVHWKDPLTQEPMGVSSATMTPDATLTARLQAQARRSVVQEIATTVMRLLTSALERAVGGGAARVVRDVAYTASYDLQSRALAGSAYTEASRRDAAVRAFATVRDAFVWDERAGRFVKR